MTADGPVADAEEGARRRRLLAGPAGQLYSEVVRSGLLGHDDPRARRGHAAYDGFELLCDLGLLHLDEEAGGWVAADPTTVQSGVVVPLGREAVDLLAESAAWAATFGSLAQTYRAAPHEGSGATQIRGVEQINRFLTAAVDDATEELLTAQPSGPRRAQTLSAASVRDLRAIERGVSMRTLYQHTARHSRPMREYVEMMRQHGAQIRTLDEFFNRLIVIDRRLAVIPGETLETAVVIQDRALVAYLADIFERFWERGRDYARESRSTTSEIAAEVRQLTVRMLTEGHSDSASAKRVGVSTRTYASYVAALKEEYGVETRFQLGLAMGRASDPSDAESAPESAADSAS